MHKGIFPEKPYALERVVSAKIHPEFHRKLRTFAAEKDATVSAVIKAALENYMRNRAS
jgi:predicted transcriptional regulator